MRIAAREGCFKKMKAMPSKKEIVENWLPRYTGASLKSFTKHILLTNFINYVEMFAEMQGCEVVGRDRPMQMASDGEICIINFGMGSPLAATIMDLLSAVHPRAVLFLGKCGGLKKTEVGDFILPIAAIRGEGTSNDYFPPEIPALPSFRLHKTISIEIRQRGLEYWTGTVYTTNRRVWEHDKNFRAYLETSRAIGIDMETATFFTVGFANEIPRGALLLVSDNPMIPEGIKTGKSDNAVTAQFARTHLELGIASLRTVAKTGQSMKHMRFE
jgi:AMP nucleosidase